MIKSVMTRRTKHVLCFLTPMVLSLCALTSNALAVPGIIVGGADIFAGPSPQYPVVGSLPPGTGVEIFGCQEGWGWCDVGRGPFRGWTSADRLQVMYNNMPGPVMSYGAMVGLPLVGFAFGSYWGAHYRGRPWFTDRDRWGGPGVRGGFIGGPPGMGRGLGPSMGPMRGGPGPGFNNFGRGPGGNPGFRGGGPGGRGPDGGGRRGGGPDRGRGGGDHGRPR